MSSLRRRLVQVLVCLSTADLYPLVRIFEERGPNGRCVLVYSKNTSCHHCLSIPVSVIPNRPLSYTRDQIWFRVLPTGVQVDQPLSRWKLVSNLNGNRNLKKEAPHGRPKVARSIPNGYLESLATNPSRILGARFRETPKGRDLTGGPKPSVLY